MRKIPSRLCFIPALLIAAGCGEIASCEQFNIDSYEYLTGVDIPKVAGVDCQVTGKIRTSVFLLDSVSFRNSRYGDYSRFAQSNNIPPGPESAWREHFGGLQNLHTIALDSLSLARPLLKMGQRRGHRFAVALFPERHLILAEVEKVGE